MILSDTPRIVRMTVQYLPAIWPIAITRSSPRNRAGPPTTTPSQICCTVSKSIPCFSRLDRLLAGSYSKNTLETIHTLSSQARNKKPPQTHAASVEWHVTSDESGKPTLHLLPLRAFVSSCETFPTNAKSRRSLPPKSATALSVLRVRYALRDKRSRMGGRRPRMLFASRTSRRRMGQASRARSPAAAR